MTDIHMTLSMHIAVHLYCGLPLADEQSGHEVDI
jgi:hypothetical protein